MPISRIEVNEYECKRCGYKWINRYNGVDGPIPKCCAKCKKSTWNGEIIYSSKESRLRRLVKGFNRFYTTEILLPNVRNLINWNPEVVKKFFSMEPRPTVEQMEKVVYSSPLRRFDFASHNHDWKFKGWIPVGPGGLRYDESPWIPDPKNPKEMIYNRDPNFISEYHKEVIREAQIRRKLMEDKIKAREVGIGTEVTAEAATEEPEPITKATN